MTDTHLSYAPGEWTLLSRAGRSLLVEASPADPGVARLWSVLEIASRATEVVEQLADVLPGAGYCLVDLRGEQLLLAQSGLGAELDGEAVQAGGTPVPVELPGRGGTLVAALPGSDPSLRIPLEGGVVTAGALVIVREARPTFSARPYLPPAPAPEPEPPTTFRIPDLDSLLAATLAEAGLGPEPQPDPEQGPEPEPEPLSEPQVVVPARGTVLAGQCPNGHLSGAHGPTCRVCGTPMPAQAPRAVPRPPLGVLVLATGESVPLNRPVVLGRAPRVPEDAAEDPHLVNLAAYGRDVSRQHAEVVLHGWNVAVRDLGSANGTRVRDVDGSTVTLEPGTLVPLRPGSVIDIAGVTSLRFDVTG